MERNEKGAGVRPPSRPHPEREAARLMSRYRQARNRRQSWEAHWRECYDYALPQRGGFGRFARPGEKKVDHLFDGTAPDAVDQLAASLLAQLTPPWARWFGLTPGAEVPEGDHAMVESALDRTITVLQSHFDRSNFAVEMHQCFLDLVVGGTASLLFEEAAPGDGSAFRFTAVPLRDVVLEEGADGRIDTTYRSSALTRAQIRRRFPVASLPPALDEIAINDPDHRFPVIEAVLPDDGVFRYHALLDGGAAGASGEETVILHKGVFEASPFINFRWLKAPGEIYGRSPVMKSLPDIKTANKVVELVLKNASIAVTGIWQADDDGVLNPATIRLAPGTIIPKAVGSAGLTPLAAPGRFDVSQLVLEDLRARIRHALLVDKLGMVNAPRMTATEVLERAAEMARILGATYGRLQAELLSPVIGRGLAILRRRGEIPDIFIDGRVVDLQYRSPLARNQAHQDVQNALLWLNTAVSLGPEAMGVVDLAAAMCWMAQVLGVPSDLTRPPSPAGTLLDAAMAEGAATLAAVDAAAEILS